MPPRRRPAPAPAAAAAPQAAPPAATPARRQRPGCAAPVRRPTACRPAARPWPLRREHAPSSTAAPAARPRPAPSRWAGKAAPPARCAAPPRPACAAPAAAGAFPRRRPAWSAVRSGHRPASRRRAVLPTARHTRSGTPRPRRRGPAGRRATSRGSAAQAPTAPAGARRRQAAQARQARAQPAQGKADPPPPLAGLRAMAQSCVFGVARRQRRGFRIFTITVYLYSIADKARGNGMGGCSGTGTTSRGCLAHPPRLPFGYRSRHALSFNRMISNDKSFYRMMNMMCVMACIILKNGFPRLLIRCH
ncbi:exported hypothetical protein [Cupriavidus taiwanensis]|nr:exported hypothetical protein [Cupriavidus taiwanensis]